MASLSYNFVLFVSFVVRSLFPIPLPKLGRSISVTRLVND
jgi:hypothetical protein